MKLQIYGSAPALALVFAVVFTPGIAACTPTVQVQAPDKPIEINMNIKIEHEIRVKVEKDIDQMLEQNEALF